MNFAFFILLLLVPIIVCLVTRFYLHKTVTIQESAAQFGISFILVTMIFWCGLYGSMADQEIITGQVTKKQQVEVSCYHPYQCNCRQSCSGSGSSRSCYTTCDTCYEHSRDWRWEVDSTIGSQYINNIDYRGIAEPPRFTQIKVGEAYSDTHTYMNYMKVSDTLFKNTQQSTIPMNVPPYPVVYDYYRVNRVLFDSIPDDVNKWNDLLNDQAKVLGSTKQANPILIITNNKDMNYRYAVETAWKGGKKNDVIVIVGAPDYPKIEWVDTITFGQNAGNSLMTVLMRDRIMSLGIADAVSVTKVIGDTINEKFDRKPMKDFEYLKYSLMPSTTLVISCLIIGLLSSIGLAYFFHKH